MLVVEARDRASACGRQGLLDLLACQQSSGRRQTARTSWTADSLHCHLLRHWLTLRRGTRPWKARPSARVHRRSLLIRPPNARATRGVLAEATVGLAIIIANYRNRRTVQTDQFDELKG